MAEHRAAVPPPRRRHRLVDPPRRVSDRRAVVVAAGTLAGLLGSGVVVWQGTQAAFSGSTSNGSSSWTTGSVTLADDSSGTALFSTADSRLYPGSAALQRCITVTYTGDVSATVRLFAGPLTDSGALAQDLNLTLERGSGGGFGSCTGFVSAATLYASSDTDSLSLGDFAAQHADPAHAVGSWPVVDHGDSATYRVTVSLKASAPDSTQGQTAGLALTWVAQST